MSANLLAQRFVQLQEVSIPTVQPFLPEEAKLVDTPFRVSAWEKALQGHPNKKWLEHLLNGLRFGVRVGFNYAKPFRSVGINCRSAMEKQEVVDAYLKKELKMKHVAGPWRNKAFIGCMTTRFGVIPKSTPGKWRLIVDLSYPEGYSVNDGIPKECSSMVYSSVGDATKMLLQLGKGARMAKIDVANAFRNVPVHPLDRHLLGMVWNDEVYFDKRVPFGLRSAPILFDAYADALEWILRHKGCNYILHYLDDFLIIGKPDSDACAKNLDADLSPN